MERFDMNGLNIDGLEGLIMFNMPTAYQRCAVMSNIQTFSSIKPLFGGNYGI
jgi:hypothetical protein